MPVSAFVCAEANSTQMEHSLEMTTSNRILEAVARYHEAPEQGRQRDCAAANLVGEGRQADRHAFPGISFGLPVQRLVLAELLEQHHRQQAWAGPTARDDVERRRGLAELLAITAAELLPDVLDHLPGFRDHLQRLGDVLPQLGQPRFAATGARHRSRHEHPLARQMVRETAGATASCA